MRKMSPMLKIERNLKIEQIWKLSEIVNDYYFLIAFKIKLSGY